MVRARKKTHPVKAPAPSGPTRYRRQRRRVLQPQSHPGTTGWTQQQVADRLGPLTGHILPQASISAMERGFDGERRRRFDAHELYLLSVLFDVPIAYFFLPPPGASGHSWPTPAAPLSALRRRARPRPPARPQSTSDWPRSAQDPRRSRPGPGGRPRHQDRPPGPGTTTSAPGANDGSPGRTPVRRPPRRGRRLPRRLRRQDQSRRPEDLPRIHGLQGT